MLSSYQYVLLQLRGTNFSFSVGDSAVSVKREKIDALTKELSRIESGERKGDTLVMDDSAGNSYIQVSAATLSW